MPNEAPMIQGALFAKAFLRRALGSLTTDPQIALTELVANAWDAAASKVSIVIPVEEGGILSIEDDGTGMTREQFLNRWMTLG